jgi:gliding motility-associated-like protein
MPLPVADLGADQDLCSCDTTVVLTSNIVGNYSWSTSDSTQSISVHSTGTYSLTVTDVYQCTASDAVDLNVRCLTVNAVVADPQTATIIAGHNATLNVDSFSYNSTFNYLWTPSTYLQDSAVQQPYVQSAQQTTTYTVRVTDAVYGCVAYDTVRLAVVPPGIPPMPNAFSPNADGLNDTYGPYFPPALQGVYHIETFRIYNRWGQLVYNGNGYWDGTFNGVLQPAGTYFYYITIEGPDQNNPNVNVDYNLTGAFTLLH